MAVWERRIAKRDWRGAGRWCVLALLVIGLMRAVAVAAPTSPTTPQTPTASPTSNDETPAPPSSTESSGAPSENATTLPLSAPKNKAKTAGPATDYNVHVNAQSLHYDDNKHFLTLDGNVVFTHLDTRITAPHAEFYTEKQIGYFTKGARITQPGTTITADKVSVYYADKRAVLTGHVQVVTEKVKQSKADPLSRTSDASNNDKDNARNDNPDNVDDSDNTKKAPKPEARPNGPTGKNPPAANLPTILLCDQLVYYWEKQEGDAMGDVKVRQGEKRAFSDRAHYVGQEVRTVTLYSNCRFERGPDDWMTSEQAVIDMNTNTFDGSGNVEAQFLLGNKATAPAPLTTHTGDKILKPSPPVMSDARRAPDSVPSKRRNLPESTEPAAPEEPPADSPSTRGN